MVMSSCIWQVMQDLTGPIRVLWYGQKLLLDLLN